MFGSPIAGFQGLIQSLDPPCCDMHHQTTSPPNWLHKLHFGGKFPPYVEREIYRLIIQKGIKVKREGRGPGSLGSEAEAGLDYTVVLGSAIKESLPWLWMLYTGSAMQWASTVIGQQMVPSPDIDSSININVLCGPSRGYERHVDGQGWSGLLYLEVPPTYEGGALVITPPDSTTLTDDWWITPDPGQIVLFEGSKAAHRVEPITGSGIRISVPMVFLTVEQAAAGRPEGLSGYLYGQ